MKGKYYYDLLPVDIKEKWLQNFKDHDVNEFLNNEFNDFNWFINSSFNWARTPEGDDYWCDIANKDINELIQYCRDNKLKELGI